MKTLIYESNNSGGRWWLDEAAWDRLEAAGWIVHWIQPRKRASDFGRISNRYDAPLTPSEKTSEAWLGAKACSAAKQFKTAREGVEEWEKVTGQNASDMGCPCCGNPHNFEWVGEDGKTDYISPNYGPSTISYPE